MTSTPFLLHARNAHFAVTMVSLALILIVVTAQDSPTSVARAQLTEIVTVIEHISPDSLDMWATRRDGPLAVRFEQSDGREPSLTFRVNRLGVLSSPRLSSPRLSSPRLSSPRLQNTPLHKRFLLDDDDIPLLCLVTVGDASNTGTDLAEQPIEIAFETAADEHRGQPIRIDLTADDVYDVRVLFRKPETLEEVVDLAKYLDQKSSVLPLLPAAVGYVAQIAKRRDVATPVIEYQQHDVNVERIEPVHSASRSLPICLFKAGREHFRDLSSTFPSATDFTYSYLQISGLEHDFERDGIYYDYIYRLFVLPAQEGTIDQIELRDFLVHICNNIGTLKSCHRWRQPMEDAFPALSRSEVPASAKFAHISAALQAMAQPKTDAELDLPGASIPIGNRTWILIMAAVVIGQGYFLSTILMSLGNYPRFPPSDGAHVVPWVGLFGQGFPVFYWWFSLLVPPSSILLTGKAIVCRDLSLSCPEVDHGQLIASSVLLALSVICTFAIGRTARRLSHARVINLRRLGTRRIRGSRGR